MELFFQANFTKIRVHKCEMILFNAVDNYFIVYERTSRRRATIQMKIDDNDILAVRLIMPYKVYSLSIKL